MKVIRSSPGLAAAAAGLSILAALWLHARVLSASVAAGTRSYLPYFGVIHPPYPAVALALKFGLPLIILAFLIADIWRKRSSLAAFTFSIAFIALLWFPPGLAMPESIGFRYSPNPGWGSPDIFGLVRGDGMVIATSGSELVAFPIDRQLTGSAASVLSDPRTPALLECEGTCRPVPEGQVDLGLCGGNGVVMHGSIFELTRRTKTFAYSGCNYDVVTRYKGMEEGTSRTLMDFEVMLIEGLFGQRSDLGF